MARIRTIKPEILEDEKTAGLSDSGFRLFAAMIVLADDHGNVRAESRWLEGQIWWARGNPPRVAEILREVAEADLIHVYTVRGQIYSHIRSWEKHQRIDNASKPRVPLPSEGSPYFAEERGEIPRNAAGPRPPTTDPDPDMSGKPDPDPALSFAELAVGEINRLASKRFQPTSSIKLCRALLKAKHTSDEALRVVRFKRTWIGDAKMEQFFRPATLLALANFEKYLDEEQSQPPPPKAPVQLDSDGEPELGGVSW